MSTQNKKRALKKLFKKSLEVMMKLFYSSQHIASLPFTASLTVLLGVLFTILLEVLLTVLSTAPLKDANRVRKKKKTIALKDIIHLRDCCPNVRIKHGKSAFLKRSA